MDLATHKPAIMAALRRAYGRPKSAKRGDFKPGAFDEFGAWSEIEAAAKWFKCHGRRATAAEPGRPRGRPPGSPLQRLVQAFSSVYYRRTGAAPRVTRQVDFSGEKEKSGPAGGAFIEFLRPIGESLGVQFTGEGVDTALSKLREPYRLPRLRRYAPRWSFGWNLELNQSVPVECSANETFGAAAARLTRKE